MNGYDEKMKKLMLENDGGKQSDYVARWIRRENEKVANDILKNFILCSSENNDKYKNVDVDKWDTYVSDSVIRMLFKMNYVEDAFYLELVKYIRCLESEYNASCIVYGLSLDKRLPYSRTLVFDEERKGVVTNEQYMVTLNKLRNDGTINKLEQIINIQWAFRTERTDRILALMDDLEVQEKEVLLTVALIKYCEFVS